MTPDQPKPGVPVIAPVALARVSGTFSGGIAASTATWITSQSIVYTAFAFVGGLIAGNIVGGTIGKCLFPAPKGHVVVVKKGKKSLTTTFRAALPAALATAMICSMAIGVPMQPASVVTLTGIAMLAGLILGVVLALLSSLT